MTPWRAQRLSSRHLVWRRSRGCGCRHERTPGARQGGRGRRAKEGAEEPSELSPGGDFGGAMRAGSGGGRAGRSGESRARAARPSGPQSGAEAEVVAARGWVGAGGGFRGGTSRRHFGSFESTIKDRGCRAGVASAVGPGPELR